MAEHTRIPCHSIGVFADGARWIAACVEEYCPHAQRCIDPFHVVSWATDALDQVRREAWSEAHRQAKGLPKRRPGRPAKGEFSSEKKRAKNLRYALLKNPENLCAIPGVDRSSAITIISEVGVDMAQFSLFVPKIYRFSGPAFCALLEYGSYPGNFHSISFSLFVFCYRFTYKPPPQIPISRTNGKQGQRCRFPECSSDSHNPAAELYLSVQRRRNSLGDPYAYS